MEYDKNICPIVDVDGVIASGKQFDLDITLPKDNRNVIYGIVRDPHKEPISDAVVKLIEVIKKDCNKEERRPVSHTFTDKDGEFVFGPLCPDRFYEIQIWVDKVKHAKICATCDHEGACLKGVDIDCKKNHKPCKEYEDNYKSCDKKYEEHKDYDCKPDDKKCEEHKDDTCKPCEKKCEEHKDYDYRPYPMKPLGYRK